jgi:Transglycosylase SLT domain
MTVDLTASRDACQTSAFCRNDEDVIWLQPRSTKRAAALSRSRKVLIRLTTTIGLGACLTIAAATGIGAAGASEGSRTDPSHSLSTRTDPLKAIVPPAPAELGDLRARIIAGMSVTSPPQAEGSEEHEEEETTEADVLTFDKMRVPRWIVDSILRASNETAVDPVYMMALADKESSFIPSNKASTSSAQGLYQFITSTWFEVVRSFGPKHGFSAEAEAVKMVDGQLTVPDEAMREHILGLRGNPYLSAIMAAEMKKRDRTRIENKLGREIGRSEFYLSHFFGVDSARKFMELLDQKPKQSASRIFPAAAKANKALFFETAGRKTRQLSVAEVYGKIDEMIDKRLSRYEDVSALAMAGI